MSPRALLILGGLLLSAGCGGPEEKAAGFDDADEDGWAADVDCDDSDPEVHPGAAELCNGLDDDCDGEVDGPWADDAPIWYADGDGDGYGTARIEQRACAQPPGHVANGDDCDDARPDISPVAAEACDGYDNDCDGTTDEQGAVGGQVFVRDADADGHADPSATVEACEAPAGFAPLGELPADDCDDANPRVSPGAVEVCNGRDDDCDGNEDEGAADAPVWYPDGDGDGYGDGAFPVASCAAPAGHVSGAGDCDDADRRIKPGAVEVCNAVDDDCDGAVDLAADGSPPIDAEPWYVDGDGDGYAEPTLTDLVWSCDPLAGRVTVDPGDELDCDDASASVAPGGVEVCNDLDDDCDGFVDVGAVDALGFFQDRDGDGFGTDGLITTACALPPAHSEVGGDCDDGRAAVFPGAAEACNGLDDDCDPATDEDQVGVDTLTWYTDGDGDGRGDPGSTVLGCSQPAGAVASADDCDDGEPLAWTGKAEVCGDAVDNDCDGGADDSAAVDARPWYTDGDGDGYGDPLSLQLACTAPAGAVANAGDCDDAEDLAWTGAPELCDDGVDNDCSGLADDAGAVDAALWYPDADGDTYGDPTAGVRSCTVPLGHVADAGDCDDTEPLAWTGNPEACADGVDNDCDGRTDDASATDALEWYVDNDGDSYGNPLLTVFACTQPANGVTNAGDCNDNEDLAWTGADEVCGDAVDNDCDTLIDDPTSVDALTWYLDGDGDTYGDAANTTLSCTLPAGYVADDEDCDDGAAAVNPAALERCSDAIDNNCDGLINDPSSVDALVFYLDRDGDTFGGTTPVTACTAPSGAVSSSSDCDDSSAQVYPGQTESCNGYDDDCDGSISDERGLASLTYDGVTFTDRTTATQNGTTLVVSSGQTATLNLCDNYNWQPYASVSGGSLSLVGISPTTGGLVDARSSTSFGPELWSVSSGGSLELSGFRLSVTGSTTSGVVDCNGGTLRMSEMEMRGSGSSRWIYADTCTTRMDEVSMLKSSSRNPSTSQYADGGAVYAVRGTLTWVGGSVDDSEASDGGCVYAEDATVNIEDVAFSQCEARGPNFAFGSGTGFGGSLYLRRSTATLTDVDISQTSVKAPNGGDGGAIYASGGSSGSLRMEGGSITDSSVDGDGGALYVQRQSAALDGVTITRAFAHQGRGGGVFAVDADLSCGFSAAGARTTFHTNKAGLSLSAVPYTEVGSAIHWATADANLILDVDRCDFSSGPTDNFSGSYGSGFSTITVHELWADGPLPGDQYSDNPSGVHSVLCEVDSAYAMTCR
jgi:hypothetical protein